MSIVVTPQPFNVPPRVRIDVATDDPSKSFTSLTIMRDGRPIREQPYVGGSTAVAFDYEAPFGVPATYSAEGASSGSSVVFSTSWPDLSGWSTVDGSPAVSSGRFVSSALNATVKRSLALPAQGRLTLTAPIGAATFSTDSLALLPGLRVSKTGGGGPAVKRYVTFGGTTQQVGHTSGSMVIQWGADSASVTTSAGSWSIGGVWDGSTNEVWAAVSGGNVPGFTIEALGVSVPFSATAVATLDVAETWLIHPSKPSLSIAIDHGPGGDRSLRYIEASSGESRSSQAQRTIHRPVGRRKAVVITSGPRQADEWTLVLGAPSIVQKNAVRSIVDDQTPLLLRSPADVVNDLPDDWYSVGDVSVQRVEVPVITEETTITLPLTPVDEPVVRQGAVWTWGDVLLRYATWRDVLARNDSWLDVLTGEAS